MQRSLSPLGVCRYDSGVSVGEDESDVCTPHSMPPRPSSCPPSRPTVAYIEPTDQQEEDMYSSSSERTPTPPAYATEPQKSLSPPFPPMHPPMEEYPYPAYFPQFPPPYAPPEFGFPVFFPPPFPVPYILPEEYPNVDEGMDERPESPSVAARERIEYINELWGRMFSVNVCETTERLRLNSEYFAGCEDIAKWGGEWRRKWASFSSEEQTARNAIMLEQQQFVIELGFGIQSALTDPRKVYRQTRSDLDEARRRCKMELREALGAQSALLASRSTVRLEDEEAEDRHAILYEYVESFASIYTDSTSSLHSSSAKINKEVLELRNKRSVTEEMLERAKDLSRRVDGEKERLEKKLKTSQREVSDLEKKVSESEKKMRSQEVQSKETKDQLERKIKDLESTAAKKAKVDEQEDTKRRNEKVELNKQLANETKKSEIARDVISRLRSELEQLKADQVTSKSQIAELEQKLTGDESQSDGEDDKQQIIDELEEQLQSEKRAREYEHAELQQLKLCSRKSDMLEERLHEADIAMKNCESQKRELYEDLRKTRHVVGHLYDYINNISVKEFETLVTEYEQDVRLSLRKEEDRVFTDILLMFSLHKRILR